MALLASQVDDPSIGAILFQCRAFIERLRDGFIPSEYPHEAVRIAHCFEVIVSRVESRLQSIQEARGCDSESGELLPLRELTAEQVIQLGEWVRELYACVRFIQSSDSHSTPPEIQTAINRLVDEHVNPTLNAEPSSVIILVRPRWTTPSFVDLLGYFGEKKDVADVDPMGETGATDIRSLIAFDWNRTAIPKPQENLGKPPQHIAIISFAGMDAYDALLYPLLAHEIGHFLDRAYPGTITENESLTKLRVITSQEIKIEFDLEYPIASASAANDPYRQERVNDLYKDENARVEVCLREIAADLLGTRMLGIPYFISVAEYLKTIEKWSEEVVTQTGYPGLAFRLKLIFEELTDSQAGLEALKDLERVTGLADSSVRPAMERTLAYLKRWQKRLAAFSPPTGPRSTTFQERLRNLSQSRVTDCLGELRNIVRKVIPNSRVPRLPDYFSELVSLLKERVPPAQPLLTAKNLGCNPVDARFSEVLAAGWVYEIGIGEAREERTPNPTDAYREYQNTCQLVFKAIELQEARGAIAHWGSDARDLPAFPAAGSSGGVASGPCILEALSREKLSHRLYVVPYYGGSPVNSATLDLRLGNWFRTARRTRATEIDLSNRDARDRIRREAQQEEYVRFGGTFALHPGDFALGVSLEYYALPPDLMAFVEGKSGLGRTGLIVATATQVAPGFKGGIVLELFNSGTVPLLLRPGMSIAQLVFVLTDRMLSSDWVYSGKFRCQVKP